MIAYALAAVAEGSADAVLGHFFRVTLSLIVSIAVGLVAGLVAANLVSKIPGVDDNCGSLAWMVLIVTFLFSVIFTMQICIKLLAL